MSPDEIRMLLIGFGSGVLFCGLLYVGGVLVLGPWTRALLTRVRIPMLGILGMRLRGTPVNILVDALVSLRMRGHDVDEQMIALTEAVLLEDRRRYRDPAELAEAVVQRREQG